MSPLPPAAADPFWAKPLFGPGEAGFGAQAFEAMKGLALARDWQGYIALAREAGRFAPEPPPLPRHSAPQAGKVFFADRTPVSPLNEAFGAALAEGTLLESLLSLAPLMPACVFQSFLDSLLFSECHGLLGFLGSGALAPLLAAGADPKGSAGAAARSGNLEALSAMLDHGMDPNFQGARELPLLLEALSKERLYGMSDKMACAKALWERGARLESPFDQERGPFCLLDLAIAEIDPSWDAGAAWREDELWSSFDFPWSYFDEAGIPPWALLPPESNEAGNARIGALADPATPGPARESFLFEEGDELGFSPNPWIEMAAEHPWLRAALELAALRGAPHGSPSPRRGSI